ncbi:hypothetical protein KIH27_13460 [Mycobacterium sp. M1]|uniref:Low molecular weight antigen MTB12-like C-terminal domain-containing protein n=1 Tax=Mycolicibacter acidiphilus TaxID=2835306 RepID=A0ABS5RK31_9MYCO|nr:hypothetical protein [Mycolicibacter acidiphilus]MBS9534596.1 hypothetical protein [Mycolicibacter acidiphilus]
MVRFSGVAAAVLIALPMAVAVPAQADCGDPGQQACVGPVPTVDQVVAVLEAMTDPNVPAAAKGDIVTPGFTPEEAQQVDDRLNRLNARGYLPLTFVVTDIQPAADNFAGTTVSVSRPWTPAGPIVLTDQDGRWLITHDTAMKALDAIWYNANGRGGSSPGGPPLAPFAPMPGRLG